MQQEVYMTTFFATAPYWVFSLRYWKLLGHYQMATWQCTSWCKCGVNVRPFHANSSNGRVDNDCKAKLNWFVVCWILVYTVCSHKKEKIWGKKWIFLSQIIVFSCNFLPLFPFIFIFFPLDPLKWVRERSKKQQINCVWSNIVLHITEYVFCVLLYD